MKNNMSVTVEGIGSLPINGIVIPDTWWQHPRLITGNGIVNLPAIILLSEIVWWHQPIRVYDDNTGNSYFQNRFSGLRLEIDLAALAQNRGLTINQVRKAVKFLEDRQIIHHEGVAGSTLRRLTPVVEAIRQLNDLHVKDTDEDKQ